MGRIIKYGKKQNKILGVSWVAVCLLAIFLSASSIYTTYRLQKTASMIYEHPYIVSNESRAMRSRLLDMRFFLTAMLKASDRNMENIQETLNARYALQYQSIEVISKQYLGPEQDCVRLAESMQDLEETQNKSLAVIFFMDQDEVDEYIEKNLFPKYDEVSDALSVIIEFADKKVQALERDSTIMAGKAVVSAALLTIILPAYFLAVLWREYRNIREIHNRERMFDILSANVDVVFLLINKETDLLEYVSANCKQVLDMDREALIRDKNIFRSQIKEEDQAAFDEMVRGQENGADRSVDLRMKFPNSEIRWIRVRIFPQIESGKTVRYIISVSDQTEDMLIRQTLKDALSNAQNANAAKQNFLSRMSHEIRTPMNAIIGMTTIAAAQMEDQGRVQSCLEKIGYSSKHLMTLINDVLDMSKIDEGGMTIAKERFNLETVVESITSIIYPQATKKNLNFHMPLVNLTDTVLIGDTLRLNQILINLLSNALKFTPAGGTVTLEIRQLLKKQNRVRLRFTVKDTGIGMNQEFMERIFMPFEQENAYISQKYGGTGLGMSITKNLVTLMDGTITVESEPEKGSTFTVELDFDIPEDADRMIRHTQTMDSLQVLIVDDDRDSCIHTSLMLKNLGIVSCWVQSGAEGIEKVIDYQKKGEAFDVCLVDWKMPDMDGIEVTRRIREYVGPETTIIIITAYDWSAIEHSAREAGANAFLSKPIFASTLYNTLLSATEMDKQVHSYNVASNVMSLPGFRVMLVEDNEINREIAVELLKMMDLDVICACDGQEAVDVFLSDREHIDLILMDIQMPVMDGYQATRTIRQSEHAQANTIPIIAMTANAFHEDVAKAYAAGMDGHLSKPVDFKQLYQMISGKLYTENDDIHCSK